MNDTRKKILDASLKLFNERGLAQVSLRLIAQDLGISPGNLTYHFKRREDIVEALYYQFVDAVENRFSQIAPDKVNLRLVLELIGVLTESRLKYRFLMQDFVSLVAENPALKKHYTSLLLKRRSQMLNIFDNLVELKLIRPEELENEYTYFYDRIQILGNFWITSAAMHGDKLTRNTIDSNVEMIVQHIYPYLTAKGRRAWQDLRSGK